MIATRFWIFIILDREESGKRRTNFDWNISNEAGISLAIGAKNRREGRHILQHDSNKSERDGTAKKHLGNYLDFGHRDSKIMHGFWDIHFVRVWE